jgi:hypothetical protein
VSLVAGVDIHVIACLRAALSSGRVFGVRWAGRPDLGFPAKGFALSRVVDSQTTRVGRYFLPAADDWASFLHDAEARRPKVGPYFADLLEQNLGYLLPVIRLADPRTPGQEHVDLVERSADFFGELHVDDAALAWAFWPSGDVPPLADLLADPAARDALIGFYRERCTAYLLALALRFEYAALFGLGIDDLAPGGSSGVDYQITGDWSQWSESGTSGTHLDMPKPDCVPPPPARVTAARIPGDVAHPAFAAWAGWAPPAEFSPTGADGVPLPPSALVPRPPASFTGLSWSPPDPWPRLIGYGPVLYFASRFDFGAASAADLGSPALPPGAVFAPLFDGEPLLRPSAEPHVVDRPGMDWPPLEGHYAYDVRGMNLLGTISDHGTQARVRHHDDLPPIPPRARLVGGHAVDVDAVGEIDVEVEIGWDAGEDFISPDALDFRLATSFTSLEIRSLHVTVLVSADPLVCTIRVASVPEPADSLAGRRLVHPNGEFVIVSHGSGADAEMVVRRSAGRTPSVGAHGIVLVPGPATPLLRVARGDREPAITLVVDDLISADPVEIATQPIVPDHVTSGRLYLHLLRASFDAERVGDGFVLAPPESEAPGAEAWTAWLALPDPAAVIAGSPALLFPPHTVSATVPVPSGFIAGTVDVHVKAADATTYVDSPWRPGLTPDLADLKGNESAAARLTASVRRATPPGPPTIAPTTDRLWATSAADYAERAAFDLRWSPVAGAMRYEVWRALEGALTGAGPGTPDADLRALAATQPGAFELRSGHVFTAQHVDDLPGKAPTRAVYRVRAISTAGVAGEFSDVIGPVHVPDVRSPVAPNLLRVVATRPDEADRAIAIEWAQAAFDGGIRFEVQVRDDEATDPFAPVGVVPRGTAPADGRFRFVHQARVPGRRYEYRVVAVREALDPTDPSATARRDIRSIPSQARVGVAISSTPPEPPQGLTASWDATSGAVRLAWTNGESYDALFVHRRAPERFGFPRVGALDGTSYAYDDTAVTAGTWAYELRARAGSREARSDVVEVVVP